MDFIFRLPALLIAITCHEYAHGKAADILGDPTPRWNGRLTLNPIAHLDPIGFIMLLVFRFGWAKPVPVNPTYFKDSRKGMIWVALAGPLSNITLALFTLVVIKLMLLNMLHITSPIIWRLANNLYAYNLILAVFNLIPLPPLDGSKILGGLLTSRQRYIYYQYEQYGPFILIILLASRLLERILWPLISLIETILNTLVNLIMFI